MPSAPFSINSLTVEVWLHGLYTCGVFLTLYLLAYNKGYSLRKKIYLGTIVILMYMCSTVHVAIQWFYDTTSIDNNELPGGPGLINAFIHIPPGIFGSDAVFFNLNILIADILFIWRCWVVWQKRWVVIMLPSVMTICGLGLGIKGILLQVKSITGGESAARQTHEYVAYSTAYFSLSIATSLFTTLMLIFRIVQVQRATATAFTGRKSKRYNAVIEIPVESAAMYSVTLIVFVVLTLQKNVNGYIAQNIHAQMTGIAPMLIILRVAAGFSRPNTDWSLENTGSGQGRSSLSNIQFQHDPSRTLSVVDNSILSRRSVDMAAEISVKGAQGV